MRSGFVILVVSAIGFIAGCNQVENQSGNRISINDQLETLRVEVTEIRHQIMHLRADIRKMQSA